MNEKHTPDVTPDEQATSPDAPVFGAVRPKFPTVGDVLALLGIFLLAQVLSSFFAGMGMRIAGYVDFDDPQIRGRLIAIGSLGSYLLALPAMLIYRRIRGGAGPIARFSVRGFNPMLILWGFLLLLAVSVVIEPLLELLPELNVKVYGRGMWTMLTVVVFAPFFEELICRGVVLESLRAKYGIVTAWLVSSLFFGVMHLHPQQVIAATFAGMIIGFLYIRTGSIWIAVILHALNNAAAYMFLMTDTGNITFSEWTGGGTTYMVWYIVAATLCLFSGVMLWRTFRKLEREDKKRAES